MTTAPLLVTRDDALLDDLLRLAAAAGTTLEVAHDPGSALRGWASASLLLVGADLAAAVAEQRPPRREHVHLVAAGAAGDPLFRCALALGAVDVLELPVAEAWVVELLTDATDGAEGAGDAGRGTLTVGVIGGSGGVGATTFAGALALTAAARRAAVLVDLDPLGPGVERVVGRDGDRDDPGVRWDELAGSHGRLGSRALRAALPAVDGLAVLTWPPGPVVVPDASTVREVLLAAQRGHDVVVVDLPRSLDDVTAEVVTRCDLVVLVAASSLPAVAAAARVAARLALLSDRVGLVVRGKGAPAPDVARTLGIDLLVEVPEQRRLAEHLDLGLGPVHGRRSGLARAARAVLAAGVPAAARPTMEGVR